MPEPAVRRSLALAALIVDILALRLRAPPDAPPDAHLAALLEQAFSGLAAARAGNAATPGTPPPSDGARPRPAAGA